MEDLVWVGHLWGALQASTEKVVVNFRVAEQPSNLSVFVLHPGITPLGNDPEWFKIARFYLEMCLNGVNTQWVYSQGDTKTLRNNDQGENVGSIRQMSDGRSGMGELL